MRELRRLLALVTTLAAAWPAATCTGHATGTAYIIVLPCFGPAYSGRTARPIKVSVIHDGKPIRTRTLTTRYGFKVSLPEGTYTIRATHAHPDTATATVRGHHTTEVDVGNPCF